MQLRGIFYTDDIILIADNKTDLLKMLKVTDIFSSKWPLEFNEKTFQGMIARQRYSGDTKWQLGNKMLSEMKTYEYLDLIYMYLKDNDHIHVHFTEMSKLETYIRYPLANNLDM